MILLENIHKTYRMGHDLHVLKGVNLSVDAGEQVAILGASGSGKSTLLHIIGLIHAPTSGRLVLAGHDASHLDDDQRSRLRGHTLGFVFQAFHLITHLSVHENVMLPLFYRGIRAPERRELAAAQLDKVGLGHRLHHRPNQLSGGECQRVAIARALVTDPDILLADEPTGNLDTRTGEDILQLLLETGARGRTLVMITHDPAMAARLPRQVHMVDGVIEEPSRRGDAVS